MPYRVHVAHIARIDKASWLEEGQLIGVTDLVRVKRLGLRASIRPRKTGGSSRSSGRRAWSGTVDVLAGTLGRAQIRSSGLGKQTGPQLWSNFYGCGSRLSFSLGRLASSCIASLGSLWVVLVSKSSPRNGSLDPSFRRLRGTGARRRVLRAWLRQSGDDRQGRDSGARCWLSRSRSSGGGRSSRSQLVGCCGAWCGRRSGSSIFRRLFLSGRSIGARRHFGLFSKSWLRGQCSGRGSCVVGLVVIRLSSGVGNGLVGVRRELNALGTYFHDSPPSLRFYRTGREGQIGSRQPR